MHSTIIGLVFIVLCSVLVYGHPFTPEDSSFAFAKCQNISSAETDLKTKWMYWRFPNTKQTHCYVKCFLEKLGLIDLITRGLNAEKLMLQSDLIDEDDLWNELDEELSGTCESYYKKWMSLLENYSHILTKAFYVNTEDIEMFYSNRLNKAKRKGLTADDFCTTFNDHQDSKDTEKCYWQCLFQHFHYFDAYGRLDKNEILLSFKESNAISKRSQSQVEECVHRGNQLYPLGLCKVSQVLSKCLARKVKNLTDIFENRNKLTAFY